jgi:hypothetical protein
MAPFQAICAWQLVAGWGVEMVVGWGWIDVFEVTLENPGQRANCGLSITTQILGKASYVPNEAIR